MPDINVTDTNKQMSRELQCETKCMSSSPQMRKFKPRVTNTEPHSDLTCRQSQLTLAFVYSDSLHHVPPSSFINPHGRKLPS
jgi:hypothetical protein